MCYFSQNGWFTLLRRELGHFKAITLFCHKLANVAIYVFFLHKTLLSKKQRWSKFWTNIMSAQTPQSWRKFAKSHSKLISSGINRWSLSLVLFNPYLWNTCVGHVQKHCGRNSTLHTIETRLHAFLPPEDHDRAVSRWASRAVLVWKSNASTKKGKISWTYHQLWTASIIHCEQRVCKKKQNATIRATFLSPS